jgi:hypothetical protein
MPGVLLELLAAVQEDVEGEEEGVEEKVERQVEAVNAAAQLVSTSNIYMRKRESTARLSDPFLSKHTPRYHAPVHFVHVFVYVLVTSHDMLAG